MKELERPKTGLISGKDIKEEIAKAKKEDWLWFQSMDHSTSGPDAQGIRRDKRTGWFEIANKPKTDPNRILIWFWLRTYLIGVCQRSRSNHFKSKMRSQRR